MKNLANCKPTEFFTQTNKIRKSVSKWLTDTDIVNIRKRMPQIPEDATEEQSQEIKDKQASENIQAILDAVLEDHPEETMEVLALMCFVEPEDIDSHEITEYLDSFTELIRNESVLSFFTSLVSLTKRFT